VHKNYVLQIDGMLFKSEQLYLQQIFNKTVCDSHN